MKMMKLKRLNDVVLRANEILEKDIPMDVFEELSSYGEPTAHYEYGFFTVHVVEVDDFNFLYFCTITHLLPTSMVKDILGKKIPNKILNEFDYELVNGLDELVYLSPKDTDSDSDLPTYVVTVAQKIKAFEVIYNFDILEK